MKPWSSSAKWGIFLLSLGVIGGIALMVIASHGFYGVIGSPGYIAGMAAGAVLFGLCILAIIAIVAVQIVLKKAQPTTIYIAHPDTVITPFEKAATLALEEFGGHHVFPGKGVIQPHCTMVSRTAYVLYGYRIPAFIKALQNNANNPWEVKEVLQASKEMMEMAYTMVHYAMKELISLHQQKDVPTTLRDKNQYYIQAFYTFTNLYHFIRSRGIWDHENKYLAFYPTTINSEQTKAFYQPGTIQDMIRKHFDYFCDYICEKIPDFALGDTKLKLSHWVKKDTDKESYEKNHEALETFPFTEYITLPIDNNKENDDLVPYGSDEE